MTMQKLLKSWTLPDRTTERTQLTLRLDFDSYARLHALKEVYKTRSVNDMINDILKAGLDEIIEALPTYSENDFDETGEITITSGPRVNFDISYRQILESKTESNVHQLESLA